MAGARARPNLVLAVAVAVVGVLAVLAGVLAATRDEPHFPQGSPEAAVQDYLTAVLARDNDAAAALLAEDGPCDATDFDQTFVPDDARVVLRDAETDGATARVVVDVVQGSGGPFDGSEFSERQSFRLSRDGDSWRIGGSPWPLFECDLEG